MIRRKDFSGAQEWIGADWLISSLIVSRLSARKISASWRLVIMSVFEGGVGWDSAGTVVRSIDIELRDSLDTGREAGGEVSEDIFEIDMLL